MPCKYTAGFKSRVHLLDHFAKHQGRLGFSQVSEYEEAADSFVGKPLPSTAGEFIRPWNGDVVRFDAATDEFGITDRSGFLKTYYRLHPDDHDEPTNMQYFLKEKGKAGSI